MSGYYDSHDVVDSCLDIPVRAVNWHALSALACTLHGVTFACWSNQLFGWYNLMRCLHLDDHNKNKLLLTCHFTKSMAGTLSVPELYPDS